MNNMNNNKPDHPTPKRLPDIQSAHIKTRHRSAYYILHNSEANGYLRIDSKNYYLWSLIDGQRNVADIVIEYHKKFGTFPFDRIENLLKQLTAHSLIENSNTIKTVEVKKNEIDSRLMQLATSAFQKECTFKITDKFLSNTYNFLGKFFFKPVSLIFFGLISIIGLALFIYWEPNPIFQFFDLRGDYDLGLVVIFIAYPILIFLHELSHAMACKHYGRKVRRAGLMFYFGVPAFFVDSTDMWLEEKPLARVVVAFAGPAINIIVAGLFCVIVAIIPESDFSLVLYQAAYLSFFMALLNLNPLLEYDGYYILMEWLEMPNLRRRSLNFIFNKLTGKGQKERVSSYDKKVFYVYGFLSIVFTVLMLSAVLYIWKNEFSKMISSLFEGEDIVAAILFGGLTLVAGSFLMVGLGARGIIWIKRLITKKDRHSKAI